jgi:hypothetical protein
MMKAFGSWNGDGEDGAALVPGLAGSHAQI